MKCRYVGDIGDFGKYGLLRALCGLTADDGKPCSSLGVMWYLTPDDTEPNQSADEVHRCRREVCRSDERRAGDGRYIGYLDKNHPRRDQFRDCDPVLYDALKDIVFGKGRCVTNVRKAGILGVGTKFHEKPLTHVHLRWKGPETERRRLSWRESWFQRGLDLVGASESTQQTNIVFVDPDNGLECRCEERHRADGTKHVCFDELRELADRGHSIVVYHHLCRTQDGRGWSHAEQVRFWPERIATELGLDADNVRVAWWKPYAGRAFFIVPSQRDADLLARWDLFRESKWCRLVGEGYGHFECL